MTDFQPISQKAKLSFAPPRWLIVRLSRLQVWTYRLTGGRIGGKGGGMHNLILTTVGRRSGKEHAVCLPYWLDTDGRMVVVASFAGAPLHPAWYHNLADRSANPTVDVQVNRDRGPRMADVLEDAEHAEVWAALVADRPFFDDYQAKTERQIPLVRFVPAGEA